MRIGINGRILASEKIRGWGRYTANLIRELSHLNCKLHIISDREIHKSHLEGANFANIEIIICKTKPYVLWEQKTVVKICNDLNIDIYHCPHHFGIPFWGSFKKVLTLHDTIEDTFYNSKKTLLQRLKWGGVQLDFLRWLARNNADRIVTVSEFSKREISEVYNIRLEDIHVIYGAVDPKISAQPAMPYEKFKAKYSIENPFLFYMGGFDERKNIAFLVEAFKQLPNKEVELIIAGAGASQLGIQFSDKVRAIDYLAEKELSSFYTYAKAFIYPSLHEGFGLQAVEAMYFGTPALVSNVSSLPEVVGQSQLTFDPKNLSDLTGLIEKIVNDEAFYSQAAEFAKKRAQDFSWKATAQKTLQIYEELLRTQ